MLDDLKQEANTTRTENGAAAYTTTMSDCLDLFSTIGALRAAPAAEIEGRFTRAFAENPDLAMKIAFFARDVRGGLGERRAFRVILKTLAALSPAALYFISDMEFDACAENAETTNFQYARQAFEARGYRLPRGGVLERGQPAAPAACHQQRAGGGAGFRLHAPSVRDGGGRPPVSLCLYAGGAERAPLPRHRRVTIENKGERAMLEITGTHNTAKVFIDTIDETAREQIRTMCSQDYLADSRIRIMPDTHAGKGCTIGTTMTLHGRVAPNMVGVDIGCGMEVAVLEEKQLDLEALDRLIYAAIPAGMEVRGQPHPYLEEIDLRALRCFGEINEHRARHSIGTLGGGNHFIEVDRDDEGVLYLVVHSGSRHLGTEVAEWYQREGYRALSGGSQRQIEELIAALKSAGRSEEIEGRIREIKTRRPAGAVAPELAYVEGALFDDYIHDMKLTQRFALLNRKAIVDEIVRGLGLTVRESFTTIHNYIDTDAMILRKGAVSACRGERLIIPINMRDGSLIGIGKGNEDWNCSAPHGAGRLMSRHAAAAAFTVEEFQRAMEGVYTTSVGRATLDECPMAYKGMEAIVDNIGPTASIEKIIRPIYNFKAG